MLNKNIQKKESIIARIAKKLPESNILFLIMIGIIVLFSFFLQGTYGSAVANKDGTHDTYNVINFLSKNGLLWFFYNFINNFVKYPPLGIVIVGALGFSFAEKTGMLGSLIKKVGIVAPEKLILPIVIFLGVNSSIASDAGYIVLVPLAGALYAGMGKNPLVGIAAAFAGVSAGFGAALIPTPTDGLLGEITVKAAAESPFPFLGNPITMNLTFMFVSTFVLTILLTVITKLFIEKFANSYEYTLPEDMKNSELTKMTNEENKGLKAAGLALIALIAVIILLFATGIISKQESYIDFATLAPLEKAKHFTPFTSNIIVFMIFLFLFPSLAYAKSIGKIHTAKEYVKFTVEGLKDMAYILMFAVFAGNFLQIFSATGIDKFIAHHGANALVSMNITNPFVLMLAFILLSAFINLFMGSASAKWTLLAPVFVPMILMVSNGSISADIVQAGYRVADSSTNIIAPLMTYMGVIVLACKKYVPKFEFGDLVAMMFPYSMSVLIAWSAFFLIWMSLGIPFGF